MAMDLRDPNVWVSHLLENLPEEKLASALKDDNPDSVSYTHLDVYKRQVRYSAGLPVMCRGLAATEPANWQSVLARQSKVALPMWPSL